MKYENIVKGEFINRPNRFIANCIINGQQEVVHVKNTGRCKELLITGVTVYLQKSNNENRKTKYDLIAVKTSEQIINIDSACPNKVAFEWLSCGNFLSSPTCIKPESKYGNSRLDFYIENNDSKAFVEVKGVTLKMGDTAVFPDAPTERGTKHLKELINAVENGYEAAILFIVQMKNCKSFMPNDITDKQFAQQLRKAQKSGVKIFAVDCTVTPNEVISNNRIEVVL